MNHNMFDNVYLYISTIFFIIFMYIYKILTGQAFGSSEIVLLTLLYFVWLYLTKLFVNYFVSPATVDI